MTDQIAVVTFTTPATTSTLDITSASITDTFNCAILLYTKFTTDDSNQTHGVVGIGYVSTEAGDSSNNHTTSSVQLEDGLTTSDTNTDHSTTAAIRANDGQGIASFPIVATYSSAISGGVRLSFTVTGGVQAKCTAILFAGLSRSSIGNCTFTDASASHEDVGNSGVGFYQPDLLIFSSSDNALTTGHVNGRMAWGFATRTSPVQQVSSYINVADGSVAGDTDGFIRSDCCSGGFIGDRGVAMDRFRVTTFDSTGFNAIAEDTGGLNSPQANYLAIKFAGSPNLAAKNVALTGSTGSQSTTAIGFQPSIVFGMSTLMTSVDTLIDGSTAGSAGYFAFTSSYARAYSASHNDPGTIVARTRQGDHAVLTLTQAAAVAQQASLTSMDSSGFTLNFTTATAGYLTLLAIGSAAATLVAPSETIQISESFQGVSYLVTTETVQISDSFVGETEFLATPPQEPYGSTAQGGAKIGRTAQGGPTIGRTF